MEKLSQQDQYQLMKGWLNERQWRLYVATEARQLGKGGISQIAREAGVSRKTIRKGIRELEAGALYQPGERLRKQGGGRKKRTAKDATLRADLEEMLEPKGDPESLVRWTSKSVSKLRRTLSSQGHQIGETAIRRMLHQMGFSRHPPTIRGLRECLMPTGMPNFSTSIAPAKPLKPKERRLFPSIVRRKS
jgi:transposase